MECLCGNPSKYKCPKCLVRYCSSACYTIHKENCQEKPKDIEDKIVVRHPPRNFMIEDEDELLLSDQELEKMSNT
jgi:hypothetical protein